MNPISLEEIEILKVDKSGKFDHLEDSDLAFYNSALVYILNDKKSIYVGETINVLNRFATHNSDKDKKSLLNRHIIYSDFFNKSVTLHLESFLINHFSADKSLTLINVNLNHSGHYYYSKNVYEDLFPAIWAKLEKLKIVKTSFEDIINSNIFKYSPYKSLNRDQQAAVIAILVSLTSDKKGILIQGNAGTGKTVIATYVVKLLTTPIRYFEQFQMEDEFSENAYNLLKQFRLQNGIDETNEDKLKDEIALVISMSSLRGNIRTVFRHIDHLEPRMVISPTDISKKKYKVVLVDEAHRLKQRKNLSGYGDFDKSNERLQLGKFEGTELDWILKQSDRQIFFYDRNQSIRLSDVDDSRFEALENSSNYQNFQLHTQIRSKGGNLFTDFVNRLFAVDLAKGDTFESDEFELKLFDSFVEMRNLIQEKDKVSGLARLVAGFSWKYKTKAKENRHLFDIQIEGVNLRWNSTGKDWINSKKAIEEVGSIHTVFGADLNYVAILFGEEIDYDPVQDKIFIIRDKYQDANGKNNTDDSTLDFYVKNIYKNLIFRAIKGVYLYASNPNFKKYLARYIVKAETQEQVTINFNNPPTASTIPYYDLAIAAGSFSELQQSESVQYIEVEERYQDADRYFACRVVGESMNKIIPNGSVCLFERYQGGSRNGLICLVESSSFADRDFGANYTIKEYTSKKTITDEGWQHQEIILLPKSSDTTYSPIVLRDEETTDLQVIGVFKTVL